MECGIGTYTNYLTDELRKLPNEIYVYGPIGAKGEGVYGTYSAQSRSKSAELWEIISTTTPDIIHIQFEFGLFEPPAGVQIVELLVRARVAGLPVVTTFHTVKDDVPHDEKVVTRLIVQESSAIVVHEEFQKKTLATFCDDVSHVYVVPHGIREMAQVPDAKKKLGIEGKPALLICGYIRPTKRHDRIINMFPKIAERVEDAVLLVSAKSRTSMAFGCKQSICQMIENSPVRDRIKVLYGQIPQHTFDTVISAADVVALPYEIGGQSGIMAHCFAFGKPVVTSDLPAFQKWIDAAGGGMTAGTDQQMEDAIVSLLGDAEARAGHAKSIGKFVHDIASWPVIAESHMDIYNGIVKPPTSNAEYAFYREV